MSTALPLANVEEGDGDDLVVFVHGALDTKARFDSVVGLLSDECRTLRYDRRGYGASPAGETPPLDVHGHSDDLVDLLDGRRAVLVGHSFGGLVVLGAVERAPELVRAVVLYETAMPWVPGWARNAVDDALASDDPEGQMLHLLLRGTLDSRSERWQAARRAEAPALVAEQRSIRVGGSTFDPEVIDVPLVFGLGTVGTFHIIADHLRRHVPALEVVGIEGAGHNGPSTHAAEFADVVRRGLELAQGR